MKTILILTAKLITTACNPINKKGEIAYHWVGCHEVHTNPAPSGETAFFLVKEWKLEKVINFILNLVGVQIKRY